MNNQSKVTLELTREQLINLQVACIDAEIAHGSDKYSDLQDIIEHAIMMTYEKDKGNFVADFK